MRPADHRLEWHGDLVGRRETPSGGKSFQREVLGGFVQSVIGYGHRDLRGGSQRWEDE